MDRYGRDSFLDPVLEYLQEYHPQYALELLKEGRLFWVVGERADKLSDMAIAMREKNPHMTANEIADFVIATRLEEPQEEPEPLSEEDASDLANWWIAVRDEIEGLDLPPNETS